MYVVMDVLQSVFWSLAYISIIVCGFRYRKEKLVFMPHVAGALNFAWEFHAFLGSGGYWVHTLWLLLDTLILAYNLYILENVRRRVLYSLAVLSFTAAMPAVIALPNGMLVSSFIIDIEMAAVYLLVLWKDRPKTSQRHDYIYIYIYSRFSATGRPVCMAGVHAVFNGCVDDRCRCFVRQHFLPVQFF